MGSQGIFHFESVGIVAIFLKTQIYIGVFISSANRTQVSGPKTHIPPCSATLGVW